MVKVEEENLLEMIIKEESWEELIYNIVSYEGIDPWDVDIVKLTDSFIKYIEGLKFLDFRIPAKVVLVAAILLKLKSDVLSPIKGEEMEYLPEETLTADEFEQIREELSRLTLKPPIEIHVKRKVILDELVDALKKAMRVEEKKGKIRKRLGKRLRSEIGEEIDIEIRIKDLMFEIDRLLAKLKSDKVEFSKIVEKWERDEIVKQFMPLLYLSCRGRVNTEQEEFFKEIWIQKK
ncbi:MAG: segregation/condensation protein A [Candidatus Aenigmarchaeota archaeon]|nr:segregation/condensation protein A [Candidatus Aenigmarchaeota archaeon]